MTQHPDHDQFVATRPTALDVLQVRAEARALLWFNWQIADLPEAVDPLWEHAETSGLVAAIGTDAVQSIIADAFEPYRGDLVWGSDEISEIAEDQSEPDCASRSVAIVQRWEAADPRDSTSRGPQQQKTKAPPRCHPRPVASTIEAFWYVVGLNDPNRLRTWLLAHPDDTPALLKLLDGK